MYLGQLVEFDTARHMFVTPSDPRTQHFMMGRFGWAQFLAKNEAKASSILNLST